MNEEIGQLVKEIKAPSFKIEEFEDAANFIKANARLISHPDPHLDKEITQFIASGFDKLNAQPQEQLVKVMAVLLAAQRLISLLSQQQVAEPVDHTSHSCDPKTCFIGEDFGIGDTEGGAYNCNPSTTEHEPNSCVLYHN